MIEILNKNHENFEVIFGEKYFGKIARKVPNRKTNRNTINFAVTGNIKNHHPIKSDYARLILQTFVDELETRQIAIQKCLESLKDNQQSAA